MDEQLGGLSVTALARTVRDLDRRLDALFPPDDQWSERERRARAGGPPTAGDLRLETLEENVRGMNHLLGKLQSRLGVLTDRVDKGALDLHPGAGVAFVTVEGRRRIGTYEALLRRDGLLQPEVGMTVLVRGTAQAPGIPTYAPAVITEVHSPADGVISVEAFGPKLREQGIPTFLTSVEPGPDPLNWQWPVPIGIQFQNRLADLESDENRERVPPAAGAPAGDGQGD